MFELSLVLTVDDDGGWSASLFLAAVMVVAVRGVSLLALSAMGLVLVAVVVFIQVAAAVESDVICLWFLPVLVSHALSCDDVDC